MTIRTYAVGPLQANCYLVYDEQGDGVVIDPGGEPDRLLAAIAGSGMRTAAVLLTHAHIDHLAAADAVLRETGAPLWLHEADAPALADPHRNLAAVFPTLCGGTPPALHADRLLRDGDAVEAGGLRLTVLHTPGHTPGSCCYLLDLPDVPDTSPRGGRYVGGHALFSGDTLFADGYGRTDFPGGSEREMRQSLRRLFALPHAYTVFPGHGGETTNRAAQGR